ncbi:PREDICTED: cytosolic carboxypeptidase 2-like [Vollenhovia emeryi]|uniref:cytosolic carboxypeptidase 2-like n=1 Tax=Vollenhovia emeryi TaxID=411798 RepID=UPI0005F41342|nr:PREDICTED: cytosolic carboxypeptidase 2-like [Vollenhovia emeryi]
MMKPASSSRVRELQAMLFPVQPIPGGMLSDLTPQELQVSQLERYNESSALRRDAESALFAIPLGCFSRHRYSKEALRAVLDARCIVDGSIQEAARWPTECQVIPERVRHIEYNPATPEAFYVSTGKEPRPKPIGDELGTVIFRYCPTNVTNYFSRSCVGGSTAFPDDFPGESTACANGNDIFFVAEASRQMDNSTDLRFESRFESGNLSKVVKITDTYYQLYLRRDLYTQRHTQWYYFRVSNTRSRITYRFSIVNMCKEESLYNEGLKPLLYSTEDARTRSVGWRRCGDNITYYRNNDSSDEEREKHTLTFNISFPHDRDIVYLAHCYPYTYTDLQEYLGKIVADPTKTRFAKLRLLCRSLAGNGVYYLTITAPTHDEEVRRKRGVVITARVHPGETPSSWTMKGIIDFLTGDTNRARELRERFVFKLVPMLNPDGVIVGNNRCSLSGKDLNRQYRTVMRESYPSVWHTKLMIRRLLEDCGVAIYCDLHAHSRKHNIFAYGCESKRTGCNGRLSEQVFPLMLHKNAADKFSFENCKFHIEKGKEGTGRVVVWSMGVQNSYTMEASMGGSKIGSRCGTHFSIQDYEQIGKAFCETLLDFYDQDPVKERLRNKIVARLTKEGSSAEEPTNINLTDYSSNEGDISQESFSSEEERAEYTDAAWSSEAGEFLAGRRRYLCVPPPSPTFVPPRSVGLYRRRARRDVAGRIYLERRRNLARRAVMELPTTDPGSDLCDLTDSADESFVRSEGREYDGTSNNKIEMSIYLGMCHRVCMSCSCMEKYAGISRRGNRTIRKGDDRERGAAREDVDLAGNCEASQRVFRGVTATQGSPEDSPTAAVSSVRVNYSFTKGDGQNFSNGSPAEKPEDVKWMDRNSRFVFARTLRNPSPVSPTSREVRIKLTSLRRQIWTGVSTTATGGNDAERLVDAFVKTPLSWGISRHALMHYPTDGEVTLKPQSKKTLSLAYDTDKDDTRKTRKKSRRNGSQLKTATRTDGQKPSRRKNARFDWQRAVDLNSRGKDARIARTSSLLTIEADSLKLLAASTTSKQSQQPQRKLDSRRKFRGVGAVATTCVGIGAKTSAAKPTRTRACRRDAFCESTTSDDASSDSGKPKVMKKKQKKKKQSQQQPPPRKLMANRGTEQDKRVYSVKTSRNNV